MDKIDELIINQIGGKEYIKEIGNTIISQMGGFGKLSAMVGAKNFSCSVTEYDGFPQPSVIFQFAMSRKYKYCRVIYNQGADTYVFQLLNNKGEIKFELDNVYCDDLIPLFEEKTGLYLHL